MTRRPPVAIAVVLVASWLIGGPVAALPPQAPPDHPCELRRHYCVDDLLPLPDEDEPGQPQPVGSSSPLPACVWEAADQAQMYAINHSSILPPLPSPEARAFIRLCNEIWSGDAADFQWLLPGEPVAPLPSSEELAQVVYVRLEGDLPPPVLAADPAPGEAAIVSVPTFVAVANWTGTVLDEECDPTGLLCVSVTAVPALSFTPGEPGAGTVACGGAGTRFVVGAGSPAQQAAQPGSCAYAYELRTGTGERPGAWPGLVTVTWELTWGSTSGLSGALPDIAMSADASRPVHEVQAVVDR